MKTLKHDGINEKHLLETLAYIETHPEEHRQEVWRCGTGMCFAGHAAITIGRGRPVVKVTARIAELGQKARRRGQSRLPWKERDELKQFLNVSDLLQARKSDGRVVFHFTSSAKIPVTNVKDRATQLLGVNAVHAGNSNLFAGQKRLPGIRKHIAKVLEISEAELADRVSEVAKANGWDLPEPAEHV